MRTADQIKRKINELTRQKTMLENQEVMVAEGLLGCPPDEAQEALAPIHHQMYIIEQLILMLEWALDEPKGGYHI